MKCYICNGVLNLLGTIPFGKNEGVLPCTDNTPVEYYRCSTCNFICAPTMLNWDSKQFSEKIYNNEYPLVDTGYGGERAGNNKKSIDLLFKSNKISHLDYGSGENHLSRLLKEDGWNSTYYDPYSSTTRPSGKYKLITAFEVFEHSTNIFETIIDIKSFLHRDGIILFTTLLADKSTDISWWYICARSGHIGILSKESLKIVAQKSGLFFSSFDDLYHLMQPTRNNLQQLVRGYI